MDDESIADDKSKDDHGTCPICQAKVSHDGDLFCSFHQMAFNNIQESYREWVNAYGSLSKKEYLQLLIKNTNSGEWVIEVAKYLLNEGGVGKLLD